MKGLNPGVINLIVTQVGGVGVGAYLRLGAYYFFCLWDGRLFELGTNSRLGAYSKKYGNTLVMRDWDACGVSSVHYKT